MGNADSSASDGPFRNGLATVDGKTANGIAQTKSDTASANYAVVVSREWVWDETNARAPSINAQSTWDIAATAIQAAWALVVGRKTDSNYATYTFSVAAQSFGSVTQAGTGEAASVLVSVDLSSSQRISAFLQSVKLQVSDARADRHGKSPTNVVSTHTARAGAFRTLLILQQHDNGTLQGSEQLLGEFDLVLQAHVSGRRILSSALFDSSAIEPSVADACLDRLGHVASQLCQLRGDRLLADVEVVTPSELKQLWEWNATVPASVQRCVHTVFEEKARETPASMAVCAWDGDLTYEEVHQLSTALATQLVKHSVDSDSLVPLCFHKSKWTPVAILAVLKAGGAFVLLDPSLPKQRLQAVVQQLRARLIICSESNEVLCSNLVAPGTPVVIVGPDSLQASEANVSPGQQRARPSSTCYVVFTSGSTGTPKGVMITHQNAASALLHHVQRLQLTRETRMFDFASYSTDVSISNLFLTWAAGGCLCVPKESDRNNDPERCIADLRVNTIDVTPSLARLLSPARVPQLTLIIFGGEALRVEDVERWWGRARIIHEYGSSECTQNSTMNCDAASPEEAVRIGTGAGLVTWVVDPDNHDILLPPGSVGELLLEGPLVGSGYKDDPEKTAAMFIDAPSWLLSGGAGHAGRRGRLYKSGDLVRYSGDGSLTYIDRKGGQAKIRGQRVELGEVEHWVRACLPGTTEVVAEVVSPRGENASPTLVVFLQSNSHLVHLCQRKTAAIETVPLPAEVEDELARHLPSYMIPTALLFMDELTKTATGKMDRAALRQAGSTFSVQQLAESRTDEQSLKQQPTSSAERCLQAIWASVLGIDASSIGLADSFFHLGGNSIAAMRIVAASRKAGLCVAVADIFRLRRLREVAASAVPLADTISEAIPPRNNSGPVQQSPSQEPLWLLEQRHPGLVSYLKPCAVRLRGPLQLPALDAALLAIARRHETLRTTFATHGDVHVQEILPFPPKTSFSVLDLSSKDNGCRLEDALRKDHTTPFCLGTEPGWRVTVYRCSDDEYVLSIVLHNLIADGWSVGVLSRELSTCYSAAIRHQDPLAQLEPLPIQFGDYSVWQRQWMQAAQYQRKLDYWTSRLDTSQPAGLFCDKPRPAVASGRASVQAFEVKDALYHSLQLFCREREATPSAVLLAALAATLYRLTGVGDAVIAIAYPNRERWEVKSLIALLTTFRYIEVKVQDETFDSLVQQVQATTADALADQDVPWSEVLKQLQKNGATPRPSLYKTLFAFNNAQDMPEFRLEGVESQMLDTVPTIRDDLEFIVMQREDALQGQIYFSTDIFHQETISNMLSVFQDVLKHGLDNAGYAIPSRSAACRGSA